jgi:archaemetzincin
MQKISLSAIGQIDASIPNFLKVELENLFVPEIELGQNIEIPLASFNPNRDQYNSTMIMDELKKIPGDYQKLLGIIDVDLYVEGYNFIFGESTISGKTAIISLFRMRQEFYDLKKNKKKFYERTLKEAIHELGHAYGVLHCKNPTCIMTFSNSIKDTDRKGKSFCNHCKHQIKEINPYPVLKES